MSYGLHPNVHKQPERAAAEPGIYLLRHPGAPAALVPVLSTEGKFVVLVPSGTVYTMEDVHLVDCYLEGPFK